jgi:hypothetical protein
MSRSHQSLASLALLLAAPLAWVACGGGNDKPPETAADEAASSAPASSDAPAASGAADMPAPAASDTPAPAATADSKPPPAPGLGDTDCGKCLDKACGKQEAACGKNTDCQAAVDSVHSCGSDKGASSCVDAASLPSAAKPKKLASAVQACMKKAVTSKACKASCK